jgi:hypothetical protein
MLAHDLTPRDLPRDGPSRSIEVELHDEDDGFIDLEYGCECAPGTKDWNSGVDCRLVAFRIELNWLSFSDAALALQNRSGAVQFGPFRAGKGNSC